MSVDRKNRPLWQQEQERCIHFTGLMNDTCKAGVNYLSVRRERGPDENRASFPCFLSHGVAERCPKAEFLTEEQAKAKAEKIQQRHRRFMEQLAAGNCPTCEKPVEKRQVGRCVYGSCGHRLYQGRV